MAASSRSHTRSRACKCNFCRLGGPLVHPREFDPLPNIYELEKRVGFAPLSSTVDVTIRDSFTLPRYESFRRAQPEAPSQNTKYKNIRKLGSWISELFTRPRRGRRARPETIASFGGVSLSDYPIVLDTPLEPLRVNSNKSAGKTRVALGSSVTKTCYGYCHNCGVTNRFDVSDIY